MAPEARLESTDRGLVPSGEGWFVLNARHASWRHEEGRSAVCDFEGDSGFPQIGININVLAPGEPMAMYHWEADQEDFLVLAGEALLIVEGDERPLRQWDFVHCPAGTNHVIVGAGDSPCAVLAVGARDRIDRPGLGRLHRGRSGAPPRRGSRTGDERREAGIRGTHQAQADAVSRRLAALIGATRGS